MDPAAVIAILTSAVATLFGALLFQMRQQLADWKRLYELEVSKHDKTREAASADSRENAKSLRELADFLHELPRRRQDWDAAEPARGRT